MAFNLKVKRASNDRSTFNLRMPHLQSAEFMENNVIMSKYVVPTDKFEVTPVFEGRCAALTNPSFINTEYHVRAFYVPHSVVWSRFDDWVNANKTFINGSAIQNDVPTFNDAFITDFLTQFGISDSSTMTKTNFLSENREHEFDFVVESVPSDSSVTGYRFSPKGRYWFKLLTSLGYKINFTLDPSVGDNMNALALLSYFRVWVDYFVPAVRTELSAVNKVLSRFYRITSESTDFADVYSDSKEEFKDAMDELYHCFYPSSYITSSWQSPVQPLAVNATNLGGTTSFTNFFGDIALSGQQSTMSTVVYDASNWGVEVRSVNNNINNSTHASNPWLQHNMDRIATWLMRSRFVGSDKLLNILARFGVKPNTPIEHCAKFIGSFTQPLVVQDINSLAGTYEKVDGVEKGNKLGDYAGKMFTQATDTKTFNFNADDYGCIIITSMIAPADINYYQGIDREILKTKPLQWFTPEFDSVGSEVLSMRELMSGFTIPGWEVTCKGSEGAGFVPRYSSYKVANATVSGDFACNTLNEGADSYHHFRALYKYGKYQKNSNSAIIRNQIVPNTGNKDDINGYTFGRFAPNIEDSVGRIKAQQPLLQTAYDKNQFNRIFNVQTDSQDHIYTMYYLNIKASRPMRSISDSLPVVDENEGSNDKVDVSRDVIENIR